MVKASESQVWDFPLWAPFPFFGSPIFPFHFGHVASAAPPINHAKSPNIIGMPREKDLNNRRSRFKISPSTIFEPPLPSYTPNPHTLVMDQLPKQCRSFEFIRDWGLKASGSTPLFIAIDSVSAKSLISFATADLAKRAWCSPRLALGEQKVPRLDLIRVWYLDASESLTFSMAEVKEGEITERDNAELHNAELVKSSDDKVDGEGKHADSNGKLNHHTSLANEKLLPVDSNTMDVDASTFIDIAPRMQSNLSLTPKGPPKGPKASILRNRVIEERIARNLQELEQQRAASSTPPVALSSALPTASSSPSKEELEARLRRLVQTTKKSKCALPSQTPALPQNVSQQDETTSAVLSAPLTLQPSASLDNSSLDDLATSFITATIETVKKNPLPPSPSSRLAALNEEIAQRSLLLTKLGATSDKAEKSRILAILRQLDRTKEPQTNLVKTVSVSRWPQTIGCILILSDDEDEDGED
ncbi:hypothetical protein C8J56DRAFT_915480 [Mycena floridula]|nr:hypothetical protein C8J56DRAFT_915480 [Mycena floridula]